MGLFNAINDELLRTAPDDKFPRAFTVLFLGPAEPVENPVSHRRVVWSHHTQTEEVLRE